MFFLQKVPEILYRYGSRTLPMNLACMKQRYHEWQAVNTSSANGVSSTSNIFLQTQRPGIQVPHKSFHRAACRAQSPQAKTTFCLQSKKFSAPTKMMHRI